MSWLTRLKPFTLVPVIVILLSGCGINNKISQTESQKTQINQTAQTSQIAASSNQSKDAQRKSESNLFGDISDFQIDNPETYYDDDYKFSVEYPSAWKVAKSKQEIDTVTPDGSPEQGISISVDNEELFKPEENRYFNSIYVYHFVSHIDVSDFEDKLTKEVFTTTQKVKGELSYVKREGYLHIYLTLGEGAFYGTQIRISEALFEKNKEQVYGILKSIKIPDETPSNDT